MLTAFFQRSVCVGRCACGAERKGHEFDGGVIICSLGCFSGLFFKLTNEKVILACLHKRLIIAERPDAGSPRMHFHTCVAGCMRTLRLARHSWKVCGSMSASSEAATGGWEGGGWRRRCWRQARYDTHFLWRVLCAPSQAAACRRPRYFVFVLTGGLWLRLWFNMPFLGIWRV